MIFLHLLWTAHFELKIIVSERTLIMTRPLNVIKDHYWRLADNIDQNH